MLAYEELTIDGKVIKDLAINGKICYATYPDAQMQINEQAWSVLSSSLSVGSGHYNYPGTSTRYDYNIYSTFDEGGYTGAGAGNVRPFVVSPHILASAQHYPNKPTGNITIGGTTIKRLQWVNLKDWALENGYTESDFSGIYEFGDIALCKCDKATAIPDNCIPYFISKDRINQLFFS